jgi:ATP-dependent DNA helicase
VVVYCPLTPFQSEYYKCVLSGQLRETLLSFSVDPNSLMNLANPVMQLRKVCNHPFLFGEPRDPASGQYLTDINPALLHLVSGKFKLLDRLLPRLYAGGHKVLIFSQMTKLLNLLERYLENKGYHYCYIDGSVPIQERQKMINHFNSCAHDEKFVFLLSTRSGGLGINLTSADVCIIFDSDWNPHQDNQAQDRCHRIGQKSDVLVYRLLTLTSVEINMIEKQIRSPLPPFPLLTAYTPVTARRSWIG